MGAGADVRPGDILDDGEGEAGNYSPPPAVWVLATVICITTVLVCVVGGARSQGRRRALLIATAVGVLFGVVAVVTKVTVQRLNQEAVGHPPPFPRLSRHHPRRCGNLVAAVGISRGRAADLGADDAGVEPLVAVSLGVVVLGETLSVHSVATAALLAIAVVAMAAATIALGRDEGAFEEQLEAELQRRSDPTGDSAR